MKEQLDILINLQKDENEVTQIKSSLSIVPTRLEMLEFKLVEFEKGLQSKKDSLTELQKQYRQYESDVQLNLSRISKSREKLRSVKNNKEYQSILKEIEDIQAKNSMIEDEMIACLDQMDEAENTFQARQSELVMFKQQVAVENIAIEKEAQQGRQRLSELEADIKKISSKVDPELLKKYMLVKEQVKGTAIAPVNDAVCQGCNLNIPPQMYNELQRGDRMTLCPHCQRILYWKES